MTLGLLLAGRVREQEGCKLDWQALWLLSLHLNTRPLVCLGYVTFLNEAEVWLNCKPNLFFLLVKKQAETRRSKQEISSIGMVESYCSIITVTKTTHSIEVDSYIRSVP